MLWATAMAPHKKNNIEEQKVHIFPNRFSSLAKPIEVWQVIILLANTMRFSFHALSHEYGQIK